MHAKDVDIISLQAQMGQLNQQMTHMDMTKNSPCTPIPRPQVHAPQLCTAPTMPQIINPAPTQQPMSAVIRPNYY